MKVLLSVTAFIALVVLVACGGFNSANPTPAPTPPQVTYPATWTPELTPLPPTATPPPPTAPQDAVTDLVFKAFVRTGNLTVYRAQMDMSMTDPSGSLPGATPGKPFPVFSMRGRENQGDSEWVMSGFIVSFLGANPTQGISLVTIGDNEYIHGPLPMVGATENRWYVT